MLWLQLHVVLVLDVCARERTAQVIGEVLRWREGAGGAKIL